MNIGSHTKKYREWILDKLELIDKEARGNKQKFLDLMEKEIKQPVRNDPSIMYKEGVEKLKDL